MPKSRLKMVTTLGLFFSPLSLLEGQAPTGLACIEQIELPRFAVASNLPEGGRVTAHVVLGQKGNIAKLTMNGTSRLLELEVEHHIRKRTKYDPRCEEQEFDIEFIFRVEGEPMYTPFARTFFHPPNRFTISTQRRQAMIDYLPVEPTVRKETPKQK